jgi:hypothetical protein
MPQPRKYETPALRQAAYLRRTQAAQQALLMQRGLPPGPAIPTMPGTDRWKATIAQSKRLLEAVCEEMQNYHDDRSETWQESERAEALLERREALQELSDQFDAVTG